MHHGKCLKALLNYLGVSRGDPLVGSFIFPIRMCTVCPDQVDIVRNDKSHQLFAGPKRLRFQNGWLWDVAVPAWKPHQQIHHLTLKIMRI